MSDWWTEESGPYVLTEPNRPDTTIVCRRALLRTLEAMGAAGRRSATVRASHPFWGERTDDAWYVWDLLRMGDGA